MLFRSEAQLQDVDFHGDTNLKTYDETSAEVSLPAVGSPEETQIDPPGEMLNPDKAKVIQHEQKVSISRSRIQPMLDLVFVMDDSASMRPHRENIARAMNQFTQELSHLGLLDYRILVTTVYDSTRMFKFGLPGEERYEKGISEWSRILNQGKRERNFFRMGRFRPLSIEGSGELDFSQRYASKETDIEDLKATLKVEAKDFVKYDKYRFFDSEGKIVAEDLDFGSNKFFDYSSQYEKELIAEASSPRYEELLAPFLASVDLRSIVNGQPASIYRSHYPATDDQDEDERWIPPQNDDSNVDLKWNEYSAQFNKKALRDNAHLGVIFVSDSIDHSQGLTSEYVISTLKRLKGDDGKQNMFSTYAALHYNGVSDYLRKHFPREWRTRSCSGGKVDEDISTEEKRIKKTPNMLEDFLRKTSKGREGSNILNLCNKNFGKNFIDIAKQLFKNSVQRGEYTLEGFPRGKVDVYYENQPKRKVPSCESGKSKGLCFQLLLRQGVRKIILLSQDELEDKTLVVKYESIDPTSATQLNSVKVNGL